MSDCASNASRREYAARRPGRWDADYQNYFDRASASTGAVIGRGFYCRGIPRPAEIFMGPTKFTGALAVVPLTGVGFGGTSMSALQLAISDSARPRLGINFRCACAAAIAFFLASALVSHEVAAQDGAGSSDATSSR